MFKWNILLGGDEQATVLAESQKLRQSGCVPSMRVFATAWCSMRPVLVDGTLTSSKWRIDGESNLTSWHLCSTDLSHHYIYLMFMGMHNNITPAGHGNEPSFQDGTMDIKSGLSSLPSPAHHGALLCRCKIAINFAQTQITPTRLYNNVQTIRNHPYRQVVGRTTHFLYNSSNLICRNSSVKLGICSHKGVAEYKINIVRHINIA